MSLYAIGDPHLSSTMDKPMSIYGREWENHVTKIKKNQKRRIYEQDTVVLIDGHSWGRNMDEYRTDSDFITSLLGQEILLRRDHDTFWDAKKTCQLNGLYQDNLSFPQNSCYMYGEYALVRTEGYCYEGRDMPKQYKKLARRELEWLHISFELAVAGGFRKFTMFLRYPPTSIEETEGVLTQTAEKYGINQVVYSHRHGVAGYQDSFRDEVNGIEYSLISSDYLKFKPGLVLEQDRIWNMSIL